MIDSHCHFDFPEFSKLHDAVWSHCHKLGVHNIIIPVVRPDKVDVAVKLSQSKVGIYYAVGLHPWFVADFSVDHGDAYLSVLKTVICRSADDKKCIAIGEAGLDALVDCPLSMQLEVLALQLQLAQRLELPIILHQRKAYPQLLKLLKKYPLSKGGVVHAFSGSLQQAQELWALGFYLGVGGVITYARAKKTRAAIAAMPLASLVLETDAPDMPLEGMQGQANSPVNLPLIAAELALIKGVDIAEVKAQTLLNTQRLFSRIQDCDDE